ncbi:MAG: transcriptional regulator [Alphaproteobacteria bacterium CG_4_10_14_0_2_um_filter_63_37]|nr:MAG: transcriptional regulator [Proteobacteria bacterium CG1_02_64_396]PJA25727.1 MAG: transcriptional regulator [Alphaproteobacteria bacterium CG_4_10_14_0_2_um_filter_63_37]
MVLRPCKASADWSHRCPVRDVLDRVSDRWSVLVLHTLQPGTMRFTELKRAIGDISQRMLAQTLRRLEEDGMVTRTVHPTVPPKVEYTLTPLGASLMEQMEGLVRWASINHDAVRQARSRYAEAVSLD